MHKRHFVAFLLIASAILLLPCGLLAQDEAPVIKKASEYFEAEDYPAAMPLYSQLLSNHREDANYNYRYGVCVLFASTEKEKGLKYLEKASLDPGVETDVWFYLGKAYHLNYQFEQAITAYTKYKTLAGPKKAEKLQVENQIAMCKTGRKLLKAITDITVLDKAELNEADFFRRYDLRGAGYSGQLLVKPDQFKTALDKKKNEQSIIFLSGEKTELYFASYGEDETQGKDIYVVRKLPNGNWGKPQNVGYPVNTEYDEDYPFLHPNGKVLYFSSKGHNSMGGYDIFRAEKNEEVGTWLKPANLDFAINSPDDDIMFVSDLDEKTAWFASNRSSPEGKMTVYHVVIERKPVSMCLIAGTFTPTPGDPNKTAKITVKNAETNEPLGVYKSNEATGKYLVNLPNNGGKYTFTVDHSGIATQTETVFIPPQYQIKTLNQQVGYNEVNNESKLFIITDFDADTSMLDPTFLKDKAKLDIYNDASTGTQVVDMGQLPGTLPEAGGIDSGDGNDPGDEDSTEVAVEDPGNPPTKVRNEELVKSANEDASSTQLEALDLNSQKEKSWTNATSINEQAKAKTAEAKTAKQAADAMAEGPAKVAAQQEADKLLGEANALQSQAAAAIMIAQALETDAQQKQLEANKAKQYAASLEKAVNTNDPKALDAAIAQGSELQAMSDSRPQSEHTAKNLQDEAAKKHGELEKAKTNAQDVREEMAQNEARIKELKADQAKEKDPELKAGIESQIEGINEDIADNKKDLAAADKKVAVLQNEANDLDNQAKGANEALAQSKNPAVNGSVISGDDKKAMAQDAIAYQQSISDNGTMRVFAPATSASGTQTTGTQTEPTGTQTTGTQTEPTGTQTTGTQSEPTGTQTTGTQTEPTGTQTTGTQTEPAGTQVTGDDSDNVVIAETIDPDIAFTASIQQADSITDPVAREKAKAAVYNDWAASIDDQIKEKKQELAGTTDKPKKAQLNADIKALQSAQDQKEKDAKNSLAVAAKEEKGQAANRPAQPVVSSEQFITQLNDAEAKSSVAEKENAKAQVYTDWADSLDAAATAKEDGLPKIKDKKQQEKVKQEIADLRTEAETKRALADDSKSKAATAETATQPVATSTSATDKINYTEPAASAALKAQENLLIEAEANKAKKDSLTNLAASASGSEKTQLLKEATQQQREAWDKEAQASAKLGEADNIQFTQNDQSLKSLDAAGVSSNDPNVAVAALLSAEARNLFDKAKQQRDSANATSNNFIKSEALRNAEENERRGLEKQQQALALYQKAGIQPIASGTQPTRTQTTGTQTEPTGTQTTGTQTEPTGTQTTGTQTEPTGTQTTGTQTEPTGTQTTGTQTEPVGTQPTGTQTAPTGTQITGTQTEPTGAQ
ncbi:MAG: hypothetical protein M3R17_08585, partial [Bacteroidota bacterium]|nr:hypothetical protein [Bacteroidota bacterium]